MDLFNRQPGRLGARLPSWSKQSAQGECRCFFYIIQRSSTLEYVVSFFVSLFQYPFSPRRHQVEGYEGGFVLSCKTGVLIRALDAYHYRPRGGHHHRHHRCQYRQSNTEIVGSSWPSYIPILLPILVVLYLWHVFLISFGSPVSSVAGSSNRTLDGPGLLLHSCDSSFERLFK